MNQPITPPVASPAAPRLLFLDALRAVASLIILLHHFASYPPLAHQAKPILGFWIDGFSHYGRSTQVFFVIGGYVMARGMSGRDWNPKSVGNFIMHRYCRLGLPYLAAIGVAIAACAIGRGWLPENVAGLPPTLPQILAHLLFLQDLFGYEHFSAGLWFVCINFQLGLIYVAMLWLRSALARLPGFHAGSPWLDVPVIGGWGLSLLSLFYFNTHPEWDCWALYFFTFFFTGIIVHRALRDAGSNWMFWLHLLLVVAGMCYLWRWRLASAVVVGLLIFGAEKSGVITRWPKSRLIARLGRTSYSLFLIHFPVLVLISFLWVRLGWTSPPAAIAGLLAAVAASYAAAKYFHRYVEAPAARLSRRWK